MRPLPPWTRPPCSNSNRLLAAGEKVAGYPFDGYWQDLGNPADYHQATQDFERMRPQFLGDD